ncbi:MAG: hypothetical protein ACOCRK_08770 [bacterium]
MSDNYKIFKNINLINNKIDLISQNILDTIREDKLGTFSNVIKAISNNIRNYIYNLNQPVFKKRKAKDIFSSQDYNNNMKEINTDIKNCYEDLVALQSLNKDNYNYFNITTNHLNEKIASVNQELEKIKSNINLDNSSLTIVTKSFFNNLDTIDTDSTTAGINLKKGYASLNINSKINVSKNSEVNIMKTSNGYPGNYHEVEVTDKVGGVDIDNNNIIFKGENDSHDDLTTLIDDNPSTWFEYECANFPDEKKEDPCKGYNIDWAHTPGKNNEPLRLNLKFTLNQPEIINMIDITPFFGEEIDDILIKEIKISDVSNGETKSILGDIRINKKENGLYSNGILNFEPVLAKEVYIFLEEDQSYEAKIGHIYYEAKIKIKKTETDDFLIWSDTDVTYETITERVSGPDVEIDVDTGGESWLWHTESTEIVSSTVTKKREYFEGERWLIGLREVGINSYKYDDTNVIISNNYYSPQPIKHISLKVNEEIPSNFYNNKTEQTNYNNRNEWIKYFISIDDGKTWERISPLNRKLNEYPTDYYINIPGNDNPNSKILETNNDINNVKIKIEFSRPTDIDRAENYTPILKDYYLKLDTFTEEDE